MPVTTPFKIDVYKTPNGIDPNCYAMRLRRKSWHPGVMVAFLNQACEQSGIPIPTTEDLAYVKGGLYHVWKVSHAQANALLSYTTTFENQSALYEKVEELRALFPKSVPPPPLLSSDNEDEDEDEDKDEDEDEDEDEDAESLATLITASATSDEE